LEKEQPIIFERRRKRWDDLYDTDSPLPWKDYTTCGDNTTMGRGSSCYSKGPDGDSITFNHSAGCFPFDFRRERKMSKRKGIERNDCLDMCSADTGATVEGSRSSQSFRETTLVPLETNHTEISLTLKPSRTSVTVKTTKWKYCGGCGKKANRKARFCESCGRRF